MQQMQELFVARARDGAHAENAGAIFLRSAMDGRHAESAGAFFGAAKRP